MRPLRFGAIVPLSGFGVHAEERLEIDAQFIGYNQGDALVPATAQHVAHRLERQPARALEAEHAAEALLELGLDIHRMKRHG